MKKDQIGIVSFSVMRRGQTLCLVKVYRDGRIFRSGNGTRPSGDFSMLSHPERSGVFSDVLKAIPDHIASAQIPETETESNHRTTQYHLSISGGRNAYDANGEEIWQFNTGVHIVHDPAAHLKHPLLPLIRRIGEKILEVTDQLYMDAILATVFNVNPENFPTKTFIQGPTSYAEKAALLDRYLREIRDIGKWDRLLQYAKSGTYSDARHSKFKLHSDIYSPEKVIMKPWLGEVMSAGIISDSMFPQHISMPKYDRGLDYTGNDDLPVFIVLPIFALSAALIALVYIALMS